MRTTAKVSVILGLIVMLVLGLSGIGYTAGSGPMIDGYVWNTLDREVKTGVLMGASVSVTYFGEILGIEGFIFEEDVARQVTYMVDDAYGHTVPMDTNIIDAMIMTAENL